MISLNTSGIKLHNLQGCHSFFPIFFPGIQISSRFLRVHIFRFIFSLKLSLRFEIMLNSIKTLKRYCKATLNVFFYKKMLKMTENFHLYGRYFVSN